MQKIKVAFFGTSDRSLSILETLNSSFDLSLCITKKDSRVGRKQEVRETAVKKWAKNNKVDFVEIDSLKEKDLKRVLEHIKDSKVQFGVVADFSLMIPEELISYFEGKLINIHFSLLPKYRGASPVQFAILNGDETIGITYQLVHEKMDRGAILFQVGYKMTGKETSGELYKVLFEIAAQKLPQVLSDYANEIIEPQEQDEEQATYTFSPTKPRSTHIYKADAQIDWKSGAEKVYNQIRAYNPWPIAWCYLKDLEKAPCLNDGKIKLKPSVDKELKVKIYTAELVGGNEDTTNIKSGKITLLIRQLQVEGKKLVEWEDFKNGYLE